VASNSQTRIGQPSVRGLRPSGVVEDVRLAVEGRAPVGFVGRSGGGSPTTTEVLQAAESLARKS